MVTVNGNETVDRHGRPNNSQAVLLRAFFINDGAYQDPNDISGVTVFKAVNNQSPSSILNSDVLLDSSSVSSLVLMHFGASANDSGAALNVTSYNPAADTASTSGIYRLSQGEYACILDGTRDISGFYDININPGFVVQNGASAAIDYLDAWTVKYLAASNYKTVIQEFTLWDDTFFTITQPLLFTAKEKLSHKKITLNSRVDLKSFIEVNVANKDIDESVKNLFKQSVVTSGGFEITKLNDTPGLGSRVTVSGFADTSGNTDITSDNTLIFNWDTSALPAIAAADADNYGGVKGNYEVRVRYTILNQLLISPPMYISIR